MAFTTKTVRDITRTTKLILDNGDGTTQEGNLTYRLSAMVPERDGLGFDEWLFGAKVIEADEEKKIEGREAEERGAITGWDMTYGDGTPFPPTHEGIAESERRGEGLPAPMFGLFYAAIMQDARPKNLMRKESDNT